MNRRRLAQTALPVTLLICIAGCGPGGVPRVHLRPDVLRPNPRVVLFLCDGLAPDVLRDGCEQGWCPNIRRHFLERGTRVENALTCVPSITYAVLTSYATGLCPAHHDVIANKWFDRTNRLLRDYGTIRHYRSVNADFDAPTIYALMKPKISVSVQNAVKRDLTQNFANWAPSGVRWFFHNYTGVDKLTAGTIADIARWANQQHRWPHLVVCYFPAVDAIGHEFGSDSQRYRDAVAHFDYQLGRVCDWLRQEGMLDRTTLILTADHGHVPIHAGIVPLATYLRDRLGRHLTEHVIQDGSFAARRRYYDRFDTVLVRSADRFATIYFRDQRGWNHRPDHDEVARILLAPPAGNRLWNLPGVDVAAYLANDNEVRLAAPRGSSRIERRPAAAGFEYRYVPLPDDVLGYTADQKLADFVAAGFHTRRQWLDATAAHQHPGVVGQLIDLLHARRCGDVVVFAAPGYGFQPDKGGHGGICRGDMRIPMMFAGPDIPPGATIPTAWAPDLAPTILDVLEVLPSHQPFDGVSLLPALRAATSTQLAELAP